jgi:beta-1,4-glucosyltransferase
MFGDDNPPLISVALATYNGASYLGELLDSVEGQSYERIELVVADDGSTDATCELLAARPWRRPVRILAEQGHRGIVANFCRGVAACAGDYVAFADQDDYWMPEKLSALARRIGELERQHGSDTPTAVFSDIEVVDARLRRLAPSFFEQARKSPRCRRLRDFLIANHVPGCALLVNRALLRRAMPVPEDFRMHDWWFLMVAASFGVVDYVDRPLIKYRQHGANTYGARQGRASLLRRCGKVLSRDAWRRATIPPPQRVAWLQRNVELFEQRFGSSLPAAATRDLALFRACASSRLSRLRFLALARTGESLLLSVFTLAAVASKLGPGGDGAGAGKSRPDGKVTAVTVTYGRRWKLLREALRSALREGADCVVVVDNGAQDEIARKVQTAFGDVAEVVSLPRNTGSAGGFHTGIQRALELGAEYLLLLDDDNRLQPGCLARLRAAHAALSAAVPVASLAVLAYRPERQASVAARLPAHGMGEKRSAFFGFCLLDLPFKLFRRTSLGRRWIARRAAAPQVAVAIAPYSGLFFHRSVPQAHGLPDERFILYADDTDFSYRLTRNGGRIVLVTDARLEDLEPSWNVQAGFGNTFDALLLGDGDFRAYYSTRNRAYFERWSRGGGGLLRAMNRAAYLGTLRVRAAVVGRGERFELLMRAIRDGEAGQLGEDPQFPLDALPPQRSVATGIGPSREGGQAAARDGGAMNPSGAPAETLWIGGFPVLRTTADELGGHILQTLERDEQATLLFANTNFVVQCAALAERLRGQGVLIANDGVGLEIAARLIHRRGFPDNLNGTDFIPPLLAAARTPVFLLGGRPGVAGRAATRLAAVHGVAVAGTCDGYGGMADSAALVAAINASGARIVVVALGNPLQERWILDHRAALAPRLLIGAGALLDFLAGDVARAPAWVRRLRLEWLYRLSQEPRRLARRYTVDILTFLRLCLG